MTFSDWPQASVDRLTEIIRQVMREELRSTQPNLDMDYLASLPADERKALLKKRGGKI